jgi:hypothetical protein
LFPSLHPQPTTSTPNPGKKAHTRQVANTTALPEGAPVIGAQIAGLSALALAFALAVTRLSLRRRPAAEPDPAAQPEPGAKPGLEAADNPDANNPDAGNPDQPLDNPDSSSGTGDAPPETPDADEQ